MGFGDLNHFQFRFFAHAQNGFDFWFAHGVQSWGLNGFDGVDFDGTAFELLLFW